jgi:hypothetical protein
LSTPDEDTLDAIFAALDCNPDTGELVWLKATRRVSEGTPAGTLNRAGRLVVGFQGRHYQASQLAWFFHHNAWPVHPVAFKNGNALDLSKDNLTPRPFRYSDTPKAEQMRRYRQRVKARSPQTGPEEKSDLDTVTLSYNGYDYNPKAGRQARGKVWCARAAHDLKIVLATFGTRQEAEAYAIAAERGYQFTEANPVPAVDNPNTKAGADKKLVITLQQAHGLFAYDEVTGAFYRRWPEIWRGTPAEYFNARNRPFLRARGRQYQAGMMAWFLKTGYWPGRKQIAYRDKNPRNTAFANLYLKDATS